MLTAFDDIFYNNVNLSNTFYNYNVQVKNQQGIEYIEKDNKVIKPTEGQCF